VGIQPFIQQRLIVLLHILIVTHEDHDFLLARWCLLYATLKFPDLLRKPSAAIHERRHVGTKRIPLFD
jgi:hypothetical protein